jgi:hypothetical protein
VVGGDSDHKPLCLRLNIDCNLPRFKYDKSKVEKYQLALTSSLGNLWVIDSIRNLRADELTDLVQQ